MRCTTGKQFDAYPRGCIAVEQPAWPRYGLCLALLVWPR